MPYQEGLTSGYAAGYEMGRREGIEQAAKVAELYEEGDDSEEPSTIAAAIRALIAEDGK